MNHEANRKDSLKWEPVYPLRSLSHFRGVVEPERGGRNAWNVRRGVSLPDTKAMVLSSLAIRAMVKTITRNYIPLLLCGLCWGL